MLVCDDPNRLGWRLYRRIRAECGCCTFYRGVALGLALGAALVGAVICIT